MISYTQCPPPLPFLSVLFPRLMQGSMGILLGRPKLKQAIAKLSGSFSSLKMGYFNSKCCKSLLRKGLKSLVKGLLWKSSKYMSFYYWKFLLHDNEWQHSSLSVALLNNAFKHLEGIATIKMQFINSTYVHKLDIG